MRMIESSKYLTDSGGLGLMEVIYFKVPQMSIAHLTKKGKKVAKRLKEIEIILGGE